jgi:hypothetical protein
MNAKLAYAVAVAVAVGAMVAAAPGAAEAGPTAAALVIVGVPCSSAALAADMGSAGSAGLAVSRLGFRNGADAISATDSVVLTVNDCTFTAAPHPGTAGRSTTTPQPVRRPGNRLDLHGKYRRREWRGHRRLQLRR